ncbi:MAG: sugar kinase [Clostridia bacterium]|nr:sugar kinase [Clostridia bacterium]
MPEIVTLGETMAVFAPCEKLPLRYCPDYKLRMAGAESNTAIGLAKLGHKAGWISSLGDDEMGAYVLNSIRAEGVEVSGVVINPNKRTGLMLKQLSGGETSVFYYRENSAASCFCADDIDYDYLKSAKIIHLTGITPVLSQSCKEACEAVVDFALKNNITLSFDPNIRLRLWGNNDYTDLICKIMFASKIVMLGLDEAKKLLGTNVPEEIINILRSKGARYIAIKDGSNGAWVADKNDTVFVEAQKCNCIDPVGAGDGFNAGFLSGILNEENLETCGKMGAVAGAMATETTGDTEGYPTTKQMDARLKKADVIYR